MMPASRPVALSPMQRTVLEDLWRDGFVRISGLWNSNEIAGLSNVCSSMMEMQPIAPWSDRSQYKNNFRLPIFEDTKWAVLSNLSGLSQNFDTFLEKLLTNTVLRPLLDSILGSDYKIWETSIRRSQISDGGLALHQDSVGEFGLSILLSDIADMNGTTVFLKGSHRFPMLSRQSGLDQFNPRLVRHFLTPASGEAGDTYLFFKNVWHGRIACQIAEPKDAILMSFVASGYDYRNFDVSPELLSSLPAETSSMLNPYAGTRLLDNGRRLITSERLQTGRLIDTVYHFHPLKPHPSQLLRLIAPFGFAKKFIRRLVRPQGI